MSYRIGFACSSLLAIVIYKNFIFSTIKDNKQYFSGFFGIAFASLNKSIAEILSIRLHLLSITVITLLALYVGYALITKRVFELKELKMDRIKNPHIAALRLQMLREDLKDSVIAAVEMKRHKR